MEKPKVLCSLLQEALLGSARGIPSLCDLLPVDFHVLLPGLPPTLTITGLMILPISSRLVF